MPLVPLLCIIILSQAFFAGIILLFLKRNQKANLFLILLLLVLSLWILDVLLRTNKVFFEHPDLYFIPIYYSLAFGPLIYYYLKALTNANFKFTQQDILHFTPVIIQGICYTFCFLLPYEMKRSFWLNVHAPYTYDLESILVCISLSTYLLLSIRYFRGYRKYLENDFSETSRISLQWFKVILLCLLLLSIVWLLDFMGWVLFDRVRIFSILEILIAITLLVFAVGGIIQGNLSKIVYDTSSKEAALKNAMHINPIISKRIQLQMIETKAYLNPDLNLNEFAKIMELPKRIISFHLNNDLGLSFSDFVNHLRVKEVIHKLQLGEHNQFTILGIAFASGFNSKTNFNRIFKKYTQQSPRDFIKSLKNNK